MVARVLERTVATVRSQGVMYNVVVQSVLLYNNKRWVLTG